MNLSFIITIDPIKDISILNILVHSLNLQTNKSFNVIFYNQTLISEKDLLSRLTCLPKFNYTFFSVDSKYFLGKYPIWDLYSFHNFLLEKDILNDYFMSLHMEEFLDFDYVENVLKVLKENGFDIMFGNLSRTQVDYQQIQPILSTNTGKEFDEWLKGQRIKNSHHWTFPYQRMFLTRNLKSIAEHTVKLFYFKFRKSLKPDSQGYTKIKSYCAEDVYFMKKDFAKKYNWFLQGHDMYFEDIHICEQKGVCELSKELKKITEFPIYFNRRKIYHIEHRKYYFQLVDGEFTQGMLDYQTDDPILNALKKAIILYREGKLSLKEALTYTRKNSEGTGTQNLNYKYHIKYLNCQ